MKNRVERRCWIEFWRYFWRDLLFSDDPYCRLYPFHGHFLCGNDRGLFYRRGRFHADLGLCLFLLRALFPAFFDHDPLSLVLFAFHGPFDLCFRIQNNHLALDYKSIIQWGYNKYLSFRFDLNLGDIFTEKRDPILKLWIKKYQLKWWIQILLVPINDIILWYFHYVEFETT